MCVCLCIYARINCLKLVAGGTLYALHVELDKCLRYYFYIICFSVAFLIRKKLKIFLLIIQYQNMRM